MRRRLPLTSALVVFACCAAVANANGGGGGGHASAPAPAPSGGSGHSGGSGGSAHGGGGSSHGGGGSSHGSGGSAHGSGGSAHGSGGRSAHGSGGSGSGRGYGGGSSRGSAPVYGGGGSSRGGNPIHGGGSSRTQGSATSPGYVPNYQQAGREGKPGDIPKTYEFRWVCTIPGGGVYYSWAGPCPDYYPEAPAGAQQVGIQRGQATGYENGTDYATDPWAVGVGPGAGTPRMANLPVLTRTSDMIAPYAVILRDGMAFASVERPRQSGKMIVARDRSGNLFSIRASEVDLAATKPAAPPPAIAQP